MNKAPKFGMFGMLYATEAFIEDKMREGKTGSLKQLVEDEKKEREARFKVIEY